MPSEQEKFYKTLNDVISGLALGFALGCVIVVVALILVALVLGPECAGRI